MSEDKQRAHDFAIEVMKLDFQLNIDKYAKKYDDETVIDVDKLFEFYNQNFINAMQRYTHSNEQV